MSIIKVTNLTHSFGNRTIFNNVSFRLSKKEHIGLVGADKETKTIFTDIITGKLIPDQGSIEWAKNVRIGCLRLENIPEKGMTIHQVLKSAFSYLYDLELKLNSLCKEIIDGEPDNLIAIMEEFGAIQDTLDNNSFYTIDSKVEEISCALGLNAIGLNKDVSELSTSQKRKVLLAKLLLEKPDLLLLDEPTIYLDTVQVEWLKLYLQNYENAFILFSQDVSFFNSVINIVYHLENTELNRYIGNYNKQSFFASLKYI
jgi:ATPase subunit of ABC transporter with duplicated ATPase domains